jgi:hypothetical protein
MTSQPSLRCPALATHFMISAAVALSYILRATYHCATETGKVLLNNNFTIPLTVTAGANTNSNASSALSEGRCILSDAFTVCG